MNTDHSPRLEDISQEVAALKQAPLGVHTLSLALKAFDRLAVLARSGQIDQGTVEELLMPIVETHDAVLAALFEEKMEDRRGRRRHLRENNERAALHHRHPSTPQNTTRSTSFRVERQRERGF